MPELLLPPLLDINQEENKRVHIHKPVIKEEKK